VAFAEENVVVIKAEIIEVPVKIGLDSMSSISLLSHSVVTKLWDVMNCFPQLPKEFRDHLQKPPKPKAFVKTSDELHPSLSL
jgi:hypothetical protein